MPFPARPVLRVALTACIAATSILGPALAAQAANGADLARSDQLAITSEHLVDLLRATSASEQATTAADGVVESADGRVLDTRQRDALASDAAHARTLITEAKASSRALRDAIQKAQGDAAIGLPSIVAADRIAAALGRSDARVGRAAAAVRLDVKAWDADQQRRADEARAAQEAAEAREAKKAADAARERAADAAAARPAQRPVDAAAPSSAATPAERPAAAAAPAPRTGAPSKQAIAQATFARFGFSNVVYDTGATQGHYGATDLDNQVIFMQLSIIPTDRVASVAIHEYMHIIQARTYGGYDATVAHYGSVLGMERAADQMARANGATWTNYA